MKVALRAFLLVLALAGSACTTSFERKWREPGPTAASGFSGKWEGEWISEKHRNAKGRLRCLLQEEAPNRFHAQFKADWMIFSSGYSTRFTAVRKGKAIEFFGSENLGPLFGGIYRFKGRATERKFVASYDSSYDTGVFEMRRVAGLPQTGR